MSLLKANTIKPVTSGTDLSLQGDSGGSAVDCLNITSAGDLNFSGNTDAKIKLPSAGGIYKGASDTAILTESGGAVTLDNVLLGSSVLMPVGSVIQYASSLVTTVTSTAVAIPADSTKPQITEGATMVSLAFTPERTGSTLEILVNASLDSSDASNLAICLFNTAIHATDAVAVSISRCVGGQAVNMSMIYNYTTPSDALATWQVRYGGSAATVKIGQTNTVNYGSVIIYGITIKEIAA